MLLRELGVCFFESSVFLRELGVALILGFPCACCSVDEGLGRGG